MTSNPTILRNLTQWCLVLPLVLLTAACGMLDDVFASPAERSLTIAQGPEAEVVIGGRLQLSLTDPLTPSSAVAWSTSDPTVVTVDEGGLVRAAEEARPGDAATVTSRLAGAPEVSDTVRIRVIDSIDPDASVTIEQGSFAELALDGVLELSAIVTGAESSEIAWSSELPSVATVGQDGIVRASDAASVGESAVIVATSVAWPSVRDTIEVRLVEAGAGESGSGSATIYVNDDALEGGDGSRDSPFRSIGTAIDAAADGQTVTLLEGTYTESVLIDHPVVLMGEGEVVLRSGDWVRTGESLAVVEVTAVRDVTLSGFTILVDDPGSLAAALSIGPGAAAVRVEDVEIHHEPSIHGISIRGSSDVELVNASVHGNGVGPGAGIYVAGAVTSLLLERVATSGHRGFAGIALEPRGAGIHQVEIRDASLDEVDPVFSDLAEGEVTGMTAPQLTHVVRNLYASGEGSGLYGGGDWWFYKTSEDSALRDALFDFGADAYFADRADMLGIDEYDPAPEEGAASVVHVLTGSDRSELGDEILVGQVEEAGISRSGNVQVALDQAEELRIEHVRLLAGRFRGHDGPVSVPADVLLRGAGDGRTVVVADVGSPDDVIVGAIENVEGVDTEVP